MSKILNDINQKLISEGMPCSTDSENAVLSLLINDKTALEILTEAHIEDNHFHSTISRTIFKECKKLIDDGYDIDSHAIVDRLRQKYDEKKIREIVLDLFEANYLMKDFSFHIDNLKSYEHKRNVILDGYKMIESAYTNNLQIPKKKHDNLSEEIKLFVNNTTGDFNIFEIDRELSLNTKDLKNNRRTILNKLMKELVIEKIGKRTGNYRKIVLDETIIDWRSADVSKTYDIILPFQIHDLVNIYPKNIIIIAGGINAGKTAFMLNVLKDNMDKHKIYYFSSEMGAEEMKLRLANFKGLHAWDFTAIERAGDFADVIRPDDLNIIDFLEISDNFFQIGAEIKKIYDRLEKGVAIIGIQKKKDVEYGRGAEFSMEKARLYISMDSGTLKIVKAKNWKDHKVNPNGKIIDFNLFKGSEFQQTNLIVGPMEWHNKY